MSSCLAFRTEIVEIEGHLSSIPHRMIEALELYARHYYVVNQLSDFKTTILGLGQPGSLAVFYDKADKIIGFTRICQQVLVINDRPVIVNVGGTYHNPDIDLSFIAARFCLAKAMRYKLESPEKDMVYFSIVSTPTRYQFLSKLSDTIYPKEGIKTPGTILAIVDSLKKSLHWPIDTEHPMLVKGQMPLLSIPDNNCNETNPSHSYYLALNPEYYAGNSLLVYIPLGLENISLGIKRVLMKMQTNREHWKTHQRQEEEEYCLI